MDPHESAFMLKLGAPIRSPDMRVRFVFSDRVKCDRTISSSSGCKNIVHS
jgi:hypothetical protein